MATHSSSVEAAWHDAHYLSIQHPASLKAFLAHHAPIFTAPYWQHLHPGGVWCESAQRTLALASPRGWYGLRVLDVGSGTGYLSLWLAHLGAEVVGVELSGVGVRVAREAAERYGLNARFHAGSVEEIPEPDGSFDVALGLGVLHHIVKYPRTAAELSRVLRPDGHAIFSESWHENPVANLLRRLSPRFEADAGDERLSLRAVRVWAGHSLTVESIEPRAIAYGIKAKVRSRPVLRAARTLDRALLHLPFARRAATEVVITLSARSRTTHPQRG